MATPRVRTGLDILAADGFAPFRGQRVGLVVHAASVDSRLRHAIELFAAADGVRLATVFGPEHGFWGAAQDMESVGGERAGVPVVSLYGASWGDLSPKPEHLDGLDLVVCDLPDVGSRYYTYLATMGLAMQAAARRKLRFVVLDRPNPIGGTAVEGGVVHPGF